MGSCEDGNELSGPSRANFSF